MKKVLFSMLLILLLTSGCSFFDKEVCGCVPEDKQQQTQPSEDNEQQT